MKYIIDTDKLPCNNGKNCTTCPFWSIDDTCEINEQVKQLPKYEERPHGEWIYEGTMAEGYPHSAFYCSECNTHICRVPNDLPNFCDFCGSDNRKKENKAER